MTTIPEILCSTFSPNRAVRNSRPTKPLTQDFVANKVTNVTISLLRTYCSLHSKLVAFVYRDDQPVRNLEEANVEVVIPNVQTSEHPPKIIHLQQGERLGLALKSACALDLEDVNSDQHDFSHSLYSQATRNADGNHQMVYYSIKEGDYLVGMEDIPTWHNECDFDYNDVVIRVSGDIFIQEPESHQLPIPGENTRQIPWHGLVYDFTTQRGVMNPKLATHSALIYGTAGGDTRFPLDSVDTVVEITHYGFAPIAIPLHGHKVIPLIRDDRPSIPVITCIVVGDVVDVIVNSGKITYTPVCAVVETSDLDKPIELINVKAGDTVFIYIHGHLKTCRFLENGNQLIYPLK